MRILYSIFQREAMLHCRPDKLNRFSIIQEIQKQQKHLRNINSVKSSFMGSFSTSKRRPKLKKYIPNIKYYGLDARVQIGKENKKLFDRILTAKPTISNRTFSIHSRDEQSYRKNILKSKFKHPDYAVEAMKTFSRRNQINIKKLYRMRENYHSEHQN